MRKVLSIVLCLMLCFNLAAPAFAVNGGASTTCTLSTDVLNPGDEVTVTVTLSDCPAVKSIGLTPSYDKNVFELVSGAWIDKGAILANFDMSRGNAASAFASATDINGDIFTFVLKVKDGADASGAEISTTAIIKDANNAAVDCTAVVTTVPAANEPTTEPPTDPPTDPPVIPDDPTDPAPSGSAVVTATVDAAELAAGDEVTVTVTLSGCVPVKSIGLTPTYDKNVFEVVSGQWIDKGAILANFDMSRGNAASAFASATDINGTIFTFVLKVKDTAAAGDTTIGVSAIIKDADNKNVEYTAVAADVTIGSAECTHGDKTEVPAKGADCVQSGNHQYYICNGCGVVLAADGVTQTTVEEMTIPALGHDWAAADCDTAKTCDRCGTTEGEALGHDWVAADCDTAKTCSVCGTTEGEALGHDWVAADCDTAKTCSVCGTTEGEALGHDWTVADCAHASACTVCGETTGEPDLTNHVGETEIRDAKAATEEAEGYTGDTYCVSCGTMVSQGQVIPKLDHVHNLKKTDAVDAACEADGNTAYWSCDKCGKLYADEAASTEITLEQTKVAALGHDWTAADCDTAKTCARCGKTEGEALGHDWTVADCTHASACTVCGETTGEPDLTNHVGETEVRDAKAATEEAEGYTGDTYCKSCGTMVSQGEVTPKLDHVHNLTKTDAVDATCEADGNTAYWSCDKCGKLYADEAASTEITLEQTKVAALGHDWTAADCDTAKTCARCGKTEGEAAGHQPGAEWFCDETKHWHVCAACEEVMDAADHTPNVESATTETAKFCTVCNYELEPKVEAPVEPSEPATVTTTVSDGDLVPGEEITVTVTLENCVDLKSMGLTPEYDADIFELVEGKWLVENAVIANFDAVNGNAALAFSEATDINGPIFEFTLRVREGAGVGSSKISATAIINDSENVQVDSESKDADVTIEEAPVIAFYGDANGDGKVNSKDASLILQVYAGLEVNVEINTLNADVNGDGKVNSKDAALILQVYAGVIPEFPVVGQ